MAAEEAEETTTATATTPSTTYDFDDEFQAKVLALLTRDTVFAAKTDGLIKPEFFVTDVDRAIAAVGLDFFGSYRKAPDRVSLVRAIIAAIGDKRIRGDLKEEITARLKNDVLTADISDRDFVVEEIASFARQRALEEAVMASIPLLEKRRFEDMDRLIKNAMMVGVAEEVGSYDYWSQIDQRTKHRIDLAAGVIKPDGIPTGYEAFDKELYHGGWGRKELSVIMGAAKAGKSMSLGEFGKSASLLGYNVLYVTLEVSANIIADRIDANLSDTAIRLLKDSPHAVHKKLKDIESSTKVGKFVLREYPSGSMKPSMLRRLLERERSRGNVFDLVIVDYADIMQPERFQNETRDDMRSIYIDLRAISQEYNVALLTATQTNREGAKAAVAKMTDVAEDFNKIRTADIVISINATDMERASGEARLFFAATRNGEGGVTLRIKQEREKMKFLTKVLDREPKRAT